MIAWAGAERLGLGLTDTLDTPPHARWPLADVTSRTIAATGNAGAPDQPASGNA
jgi:N6-L-threonylcarbamoyladenine synthase